MTTRHNHTTHSIKEVLEPMLNYMGCTCDEPWALSRTPRHEDIESYDVMHEESCPVIAGGDGSTFILPAE